MVHDRDWLGFITDLPDSILRFGMKAIIDALPSLANLKRWTLIRPGREVCPHCIANVETAHDRSAVRAQTTIHVLSACPRTLGKRRWRHDSILSALVGFIDNRTASTTELLVDLKGHARSYHVFPPEYGETSLRPDLLLFDKPRRKFAIVELSVPAEENIEERRQKKLAKYRPLQRNVSETVGSGWAVELVTIEIGACGLQQTSLSRGMKALAHLGLLDRTTAHDLADLSKRLSFIALRCSYAIWATRKATDWSPDMSLAP